MTPLTKTVQRVEELLAGGTRAGEEAASAGAAASSGRGSGPRDVAAATKTSSFFEKLRSLGADFLDQMEAKGGHALSDHVSQTPQDLTRRCKLSTRSGKRRDLIDAAISFTNKYTANMAVKENLIHHVDGIAQWLANSEGKYGVFVYQHNHTIGYGTTRLAQAMKTGNNFSRNRK